MERNLEAAACHRGVRVDELPQRNFTAAERQAEAVVRRCTIQMGEAQCVQAFEQWRYTECREDANRRKVERIGQGVAHAYRTAKAAAVIGWLIELAVGKRVRSRHVG